MAFQGRQVWFLTGSQDLYGEEALRRVKEQSAEIAAGLDMQILDRSDLQAKAPYISGEMIGGVYCPIEGKADPLRAAPAFAAAAVARGAAIRRGNVSRSTALRRIHDRRHHAGISVGPRGPLSTVADGASRPLSA